MTDLSEENKICHLCKCGCGMTNEEKDEILSRAFRSKEGLSCLAEVVNHRVCQFVEMMPSRRPLMVDELSDEFVSKNFDPTKKILTIPDDLITLRTTHLRSCAYLPLKEVEADRPGSIDFLVNKVIDGLRKNEGALVFGELLGRAKKISLPLKTNSIAAFNSAFNELEKPNDPSVCVVIENIFASFETWKKVKIDLKTSDPRALYESAISFSSERDQKFGHYGVLWTSDLRLSDDIPNNEFLITISPDMTGALYIINDITTKVYIENDQFFIRSEEDIALRFLDETLAVHLSLQSE